MPPTLDLTAGGILDRLPPALRALLMAAARVAGMENARLWLVGGAVRDTLLGRDPGRDLDLAVEGDVVALAPALAAGLGGAIVASHAPFGTASLLVGGVALDLARARVERYPRPAALPEVQPADIAADLIRRDFSVNAVAVELRPGGAGALLDPFGGRADLRAGLLRLLHPLSLRDDPTRLLRCLRLAARLGLHPEPGSAGQIAEAVGRGYLGLLTAERVQAELCLTLAEPRPDEVLRLAVDWGAAPQVAAGLAHTPALAARCARFAADPAPFPGIDPGLTWLGLLTYDLDDAARAALATRYRAPAAAAALLRELGQARALVPALAELLPPSALDRLLHPRSGAAISVLHYAEPGTAAATARYLRELRPHKAPLDGDDLRRLGVAPGPGLGRMLAELRAASLDGAVVGRDDAERWVRGHLHSAG